MPKRGENIRKRKDGRWEARPIDYYRQDGKAHHKSIYAQSYAEVKQKVKLFFAGKLIKKNNSQKVYCRNIAGMAR